MSEFDVRIEAMRAKSNKKRALDRVNRQVKIANLAIARDKKRAEMRESMPEIASVVDKFKAAFGNDQVRVLYAEENGVVVKARGFEL